jgi:hypothetical protein
MQPVQKKSRGKRKPWLIFSLLAIFAVALLLLFILTAKPNEAQDLPKSPDENLTLVQKDAEDLVRIEVSPSFGEGFALVKEGGVFVVEGSPDFPLEAREIDLMVKDLTLLVANEALGQIDPFDGESMKALGLGEDAARAWATYQDGERKGFIFGAVAATEVPADYFMLERDSRVFAVSQETRSHFDRTLNTLHPVPALNFTSDLLNEAVFKGEGAFTLTLKEGLWELSSPGRYPADETAVKAFLGNIGQMRLAVYVGEATEENLSLYGFTPAGRSVTFHLAPSAITAYDEEGTPVESRSVEAQTLTLSIGMDIDRIGFCCLYGGSIWQVSLASMGFLRDAGWEGFHSRTPVNIPVNRLEVMQAEKGGSVNVYQISLVESILPNNALELDEAGNPLFLPEIRRNGLEMERDGFLREYLRLMALKASGNLPEGYAPNGNITARYHLSGAGIDLEVALYPFDALHYAIKVNGRFADYVDRRSADAIAL